jgi:hypothetical protein
MTSDAAAAKCEIMNDFLSEISESANIEYLPLWPALCIENCIVEFMGKTIYSDDDHLSMYGASEILAPRIHKRIKELGVVEGS